MIAVSYLIKRKIKKVFFEVISKTKILFSGVDNDQDFFKLTGGLDKEETGQRQIRYLY